MPKGTMGFVYVITNIKTKKFYIGKKNVLSFRKKRIGKREKALTKTRKTFKHTVTETDWKKYYGSSEDLKKDIKKYGVDNFERVIIEFASNKKYLTFIELKWQMKHDVLTNDTYNGNIASRYFRKDMENKPVKSRENEKI